MGKYKKIRVKKKVESYDINSYYFTGKFPELLKNIETYINEIIETYEIDYPSFIFDCEYSIVTEVYGYDGGEEFYLYVERYETDDEYEKRVKGLKRDKEKIKEAKEKKKKDEIALLKKLKNKYPDAV